MVVQPSLRLTATIDGEELCKKMSTPPFHSMFGHSRNDSSMSLSSALTCALLVCDANATFAVSSNANRLAVSRGSGLSIVCLYPLSKEESVFYIGGCPIGETISALQWLNDSHILVGYSNGVLRLYTNGGRVLCHSQRLHTAPILSIELSAPNRSSDSSTTLSDAHGVGGSGGGIWVLYEDKVVVRVHASQMITPPMRQFTAESGKEFSLAAVDAEKWELEGQESVCALVHTGRVPATLFQMSSRPGSAQLLAVGTSPIFACYELGVTRNQGSLGKLATAVVSNLSSAVTHTLSSFARSWRWGGGEDSSAAAAAASEVRLREEEEKKEGTDAPQEVLELKWAQYDARRTVHTVQLDPTGQLAVATCGFGRVLLLDVAGGTVVRMWKGARDAQCGWLQAPERWAGQWEGVACPTNSSNNNSSNNNNNNPNPNPGTGSGGGGVTSYGLYLAIYAPRTGLLNVWRMRHGPCMMTVAVGASARIIWTPGARGGGGRRGWGWGRGRGRLCSVLCGEGCGRG